MLTLGVIFAAPDAVAGQETDTVRLGPPDTILPPVRQPPADSFEVVPPLLEPDDTLGPAADTVAELAPMRIGAAQAQSFADGVWVWDRAALRRTPALNLAELIGDVVGLRRVRAGYYGQPEVVVAPDALSGDVEVLFDGYPLDPLTGTTPDLGRIMLVHLERVRVERRGGRVRIELVPISLEEPRAYTDVRIATGDLGTDGLAGVFLAPSFLIGPFSVAIEQLGSDGTLRNERATMSTAWVRWALLRERWGVHAEYRRDHAQRSRESPRTGEATREDLILRARVRPFDFLSAELYAGRSAVEDRFIVDTVATDLSVTQWGLRTSYQRGPVATLAALRFRNGDGGPDMSAELEADLAPFDWASIGAAYRFEGWDETTASSGGAHARVGVGFGAQLFAEWAGGSHGLHWITRDGERVAVERTSLRSGVAWRLGGWHAAAAYLRAHGDSVAPPVLPGLGPFGSRLQPLYPGFDVHGLEARLRIPLLIEPLALELGYTHLSPIGDASLTIFQPDQQGSAALAYHDLPLETDQLEIAVRLRGEYRGAMLAPTQVPGELATVDATQRLDLEVAIRVLDVTAYVRWQNLLHDQELEDVPGQTLPGQAAWFGVDWVLWN